MTGKLLVTGSLIKYLGKSNFFLLLIVIGLLHPSTWAWAAGIEEKDFHVPREDNALHVQRIVPPYLAEHNTYFQTETVQVGDYPVWLIKNASNQMSNSVMIEGKESLVILDTGASRYHGAAILTEIRKISDKPIETIIYTHHHGDHTTGAGAIVDKKDVEDGRVKIFARSNFMQEYIDEDFMTGPIQALRSVYQFGGVLPESDLKDYVIGLSGGVLPSGTGAFIKPNAFIEKRQTLELSGIDFEFIPTGGESATHQIVWLPKFGIVLSGDEVYPALPNLHSLRGTKFRDARNWVRAIDIIRELQADYLVPSHGPIIAGRDNMENILAVYRDAVQYQHDQAVRFINKGYTREALVEQLSELPESLKMIPYTEEMYGKLSHNIPNIFHGYIGWFSGDAVDLSPTPKSELAQRFVELMGGGKRVFKEANKAFLEGNSQYAAELATLLLRLDPTHEKTRKLKAAAFRKVGYREINSTWRSWYLTAAEELDGNFDIAVVWKEMMANLRGVGNLSGMPTINVLELLRYSVAAERAGDVNVRLRWEITDRNEVIYSELRRGVLEVSTIPMDLVPHATLKLTRQNLNALVAGMIEAKDAISEGQIEIAGDKEALQRFFKYQESFDFNVSLSAQ